jgi:hypothetical protein
MKKRMLLLASATVCFVSAALADDMKVTMIYPPQGQPILVYERVPEHTTVALYRSGRGVGAAERARNTARTSSESRVVTRSFGNSQPVSYVESKD